MAASIDRPVDLVRLLTAEGLSLRKAHHPLNRIASGEHVPIRVAPRQAAELVKRLPELGVSAASVRSPEVEVRAVRDRLGLSQPDFAARFGFTLDTVQNWEQGRNRPEGPAQTLLKIIDMHPEVVDEALRAGN